MSQPLGHFLGHLFFSVSLSFLYYFSLESINRPTFQRVQGVGHEHSGSSPDLGTRS